MILRAISSLIAIRDSLTLTITLPPSELTEILEMLFDLRAAADFFDDIGRSEVRQRKRHHTNSLFPLQ